MPNRFPLKWVILAIFLALGTAYSLVTPIFEASDERWHYPVVNYIAWERALPVQDPAQATAWHQEGSQPPLYYMLASLVTISVDADDLESVLRPNPHAIVGLPLEVGNKNMMLHSPLEGWPWHKTVLAVHLIRLLSVALGACSVWLTWKIAERLAPQNKWLPPLAATLTAFNPMFLFISASVNNDTLAAPLAAGAVYILITVVQRPEGQRLSDGVVLGVLLGLGALTKLSVLALLPIAAGALTWDAARGRRWRLWLTNGLIIAALAALIAGWWYWRNWSLYGDPTGINRMLDIAGRRHEPFDLARMRAEFEGFRISYWAQFGALNIVVSRWIYRLLDVLSVVSIIGLGVAAARVAFTRRKPTRLKADSSSPSLSALLLLSAWVAAVLFSLLRWTSQTYASQGRLMFVAIAGISSLLALGILSLTPRRFRPWVPAAIGGGLLVLAILCPVVYIRPAYATPAILQQTDMPPDLVSVDWTIEGKMRLVGYLPLEAAEMGLPTVRPVEKVPITLYWQALAPMEKNYSVFVKLLGREGEVVGQVNTYPGLGAHPTNTLEAGDIVADTYLVPVAADAKAPSLLRVHAGLYDYDAPGRPALPMTDAQGNLVEPHLTTLRLIPWDWPPASPQVSLGVDFGDTITLTGFDLSRGSAPEEWILTLYWRSKARPTGDYTVFIQLWEDGEQTAGFDGPPLGGDYPTSWWGEGETIIDPHPLHIPAETRSSSQMRVGLYELESGTRVPAARNGTPLPDYAASIELAQ
jgi:hypothetical protein